MGSLCEGREEGEGDIGTQIGGTARDLSLEQQTLLVVVTNVASDPSCLQTFHKTKQKIHPKIQTHSLLDLKKFVLSPSVCFENFVSECV